MDPVRKQLRSLKQITLDAQKQAAFRTALEYRVRADMRINTVHASIAKPVLRISMLRHLFHAPSFTLAIIITILGSGGGIAFASQSALPGTALYGMKLKTEQARLTLTRDDNKKAALHIAFASRRMHEIEELIDNDASEDATITDTVAYYEHELQAGELLLKNDDRSAETAATLIAAAETHKDTLKNLKAKISERAHAHLESRLEEAFEHTETHSDAALLTVFSSMSTSSEAAPISKAVIETSRKKVRSLEKELAEQKRAVEDAQKGKGKDDAAITEATTKLESARTIVENAKSRIEHEEYRESIERSIEARALIKEASSWSKKRENEEERKKEGSSRERDNDEKDTDDEH